MTDPSAGGERVTADAPDALAAIPEADLERLAEALAALLLAAWRRRLARRDETAYSVERPTG